MATDIYDKDGFLVAPEGTALVQCPVCDGGQWAILLDITQLPSPIKAYVCTTPGCGNTLGLTEDAAQATPPLNVDKSRMN